MFSKMLVRCTDTFPKIYKHQFNFQLYTGSLPSRTFRLFLEQDKLYLRDFSLALLLVSARFNNENYALQFRTLSTYINEAELNLHRNYLDSSHPCNFFTPVNKIKIVKIPVIEQYTAHLLHNAELATIQEAVACLIPCFWIYSELGKQMDISKCCPNNPYKKWIATYSDEEFISKTTSVIHTLDELTNTICCPELEEKIICAFYKSAEFELGFFDASMEDRKETVPSCEDKFIPC